MKREIDPTAWHHLVRAAILLILVSTVSSARTTHVIEFGGTLGLVYSPNSLSVAVGDTIQWQGDFSTHPLSSTTIPAGATAWHNGTGTVFNYVVNLPGMYNYHCDNHFTLGMVGSFNAAVTSVNNQQSSQLPPSFRLEDNYPNPFNPSTTIKYELPRTSHVTLKVYNILGSEVATLLDEEMSAGVHSVQWDASGVSSGVYLYQLTAGKFVQTRRMVLLR